MPFNQNQYDIRRHDLPAELSQEIWANAVKESAVMQLAQRVDLPGRGLAIPVLTGDAIANWTVETGTKPISNATYTMKPMQPYKLAVIETFSEEFTRDAQGMYRDLVRRLPASIGHKLDATVFGGTAPGTGFDVLTDCTVLPIAPSDDANVYQQLIALLELLGANGYDLTGFALSAQAQALILGAVDNAGRPIFSNNPTTEGALGEILGARVVKSQETYDDGEPAVIGYAGDFSKMRYGIVGDINVTISSEASLDDGNGGMIPLFQRNMVAVRVEAEVGVVVADDAAFVKLSM